MIEKRLYTGSSQDLEKIEINLLLQGIYEWYGCDYRDYAYHSIRRRIWHRVHAEKLNTILDFWKRYCIIQTVCKD